MPETAEQPVTWGFFLRVSIKGVFLFAICNLCFALIYPMQALGNLSLYNRILPPRTRLPYGENPALWNNISVMNLNAMFASHVIQQATADDEFRVILLGDSNTWGFRLAHDETLAAQMNQAQMTVGEQRVVAYNLGYPQLSLTKDLLILDEALQYQPDLIIWLVTLRSFALEQQLLPELVLRHRQQIRSLIDTYNLSSNPNDSRFIEPNFWQRTIIGQRRNLADLLRLQSYGFAWSATDIDQFIPDDYNLRQSDFEADLSWGDNYPEPLELTQDDLAFDVLSAGFERSADIPIWIINEPMFISDGDNSDLRYNSFYPRWAYDQYRVLLADFAQENNWHYVDWWDMVAPDDFTDSPVHLTTQATQQISRLLLDGLTKEAQ
ncbi:MAG: hypothetical protein Q9P01_21445 [Anaerolineae bacterium]|nr:hypothetical protein [Anaerolineae bacterium]MDQ7037309.1 hypothetical protein [Anaerolineae bacterium]